MSAPDCAVFGGGDDQPLCNLYSVTKGQQAIRELAGAMRDRTSNLPPLPSVFPDYAAPIVRNQPEGSELTMKGWHPHRWLDVDIMRNVLDAFYSVATANVQAVYRAACDGLKRHEARGKGPWLDP